MLTASVVFSITLSMKNTVIPSRVRKTGQKASTWGVLPISGLPCDSASQGMPEPWDVLGSYAASRLLSEYRLTGNFQKPIR